jgi:guanine nucleotide-binding protein subunit beta-2-like 1 protein
MSEKSDKLTVEYIGFLSGHNGWVTSLAVGKDANGNPLLISGSRDRSLIVWNLNFEKPEEVVVQVKPEEVIDYRLGKPAKSLKGHAHFVSSLAIARDNKHVVSSSWDKTMRLWDLTTMTTKQLFTGHTKDVLAATFSQDNRMVLSGGMDKTFKVWNTKGEEKYHSDRFDGWVSSICNINQGKNSLLAVGSWDSKVRIFDSQNFGFVRGLVSPTESAIVSMATDEDGDYLFVGQKNGSVNIWSLASESNETDKIKQKFDINADLNTLCYDSKYFAVLTLGTSKGISVREIKGNTELWSRGEKEYGKNVGCLALAFDESKNYLFAGFTDGMIRVYKFSTQKQA